MQKKYKILHLEDVPTDAELVARELSANNIAFEHHVVDSEVEYVKALKDFSPDIILSDHSMPNFNSFEAFRILKEQELNIPFIIITATLTDEVAMKMVRKGVDDYILKDRLKRLPHAVINAVEKFRFEKDRKQLIDQVYQDEAISKELLTQLSGKVLLATKASGIGIWEYIFNEERFVADDIMLQQYALLPNQFKGNYESLIHFVHADDKQKVIDTFMQAFGEHAEVDVEFRIVWEDATIHFIKAAAVIQYNALGKPDRILGTHQDITAAKNAELKLTESENRFRAIIEKSSELITLTTSEGKVIYISPSFTKTLGYTFKDIRSKILFSFFHPDDVKEFHVNRKKILDNHGSLIDYQIRFQHKNGKWVWCECTLTNLLEEPGVQALVKNFRDITEKKQAENFIKESEAKYRAFFENSLDGILLTVTDGSILAANPAACAMFRMTEDEICAAGRMGLVDLSDPRVEQLIKERQKSGKASGELTYKRKDGTTFPGEISSVLFTDSYGQERTSMIVRDISKRKEAEEILALTSYELQYALNDINKIMDSSLDVICAVDENGIFKKVSAASEAVWGYKPEELIGKPLFDYVHQEDNDITRQTAAEVMKGKSITYFENRYIRKDGTLVNIEWSARWDANDKMRYGVARDVTVKKRLEKAFEYEKQRFVDMFATAPASLGILKGPEHVFEMANPNYLKLVGRENIIGKNVREVFPELLDEGFFGMLDSVYKTGKPVIIKEAFVPFKNEGIDTPKYLDFMYQAYKDFEGKTEGIFFFAIDVTEQVLSRKKIEESYKEFQFVTDFMPQLIWVTKPDGYHYYYNMQWYDYTGLPPHETEGEGWNHVFHPDDQDMAWGLWRHSLATGEPYEIEYRCRRYDGEYRWFLGRALPLKDSTGNILKWFGTCTDIDDQKKATESLRKSEERYRQIVDTAQEGIWLIDETNKTTFVNNKLCEILEYSQEEFAGKEIYDFMDDEGKQLAAGLMEQKKLGISDILSFKYITKTGKEIWTNISTNPLFSDEGDYIGALAMVSDITTIKKANDQIKESESRYRSLIEQATNAICIADSTMKFIEVNPYASQLFGYSKEEWLELSITDILIKADLIENPLKTLELQSGQSVKNERRVKRKDGTVLDIELSTRIDPYGNLIIFGHDITERKLAERKLKESNSKYKAIIDNTINAFLLSDTEGNILEVNETACKTLGYTGAELLKLNRKDIFEMGSPEYLKAVQTRKAKGIASGEVYGIKKTGERVPIAFTTSVFYTAEGEARLSSIGVDITDKKIAETALTESRNYLRTIIEAEPECVKLLDKNGRLQEMNPAGLAMIEADNLAQVKGFSVLDIINAPYREAFDRLTKDGFKGISGTLQFEITGFKGTRRWLETNSVPLRNGEGEIISLLSVTRDISERKKSEENLVKSHERFINVSKATFDVVWDWDINTRELYLGDGFNELFGYEIHDTRDFPSWSIHIHPDDREKVITERLNKIIHHDESNWKDEYRYIKADGSIAYVSDRGILLRNETGTYRMIGAMQDITDVKQHELSITGLNDMLKQQANKLIVSNEELERFAYVTSHDLQEPLRMVTSFLQLLQKKYNNQLDETARKYINFAVDGAGRMRTLIHDLLEFSRISSVASDPTLVNLNDVINKTRIALKAAVEQSGAVINVPFLPAIRGNQIQLLQLFQNLIGNSIKYKNGSSPVIDISYTESPVEWEFCVADNGIGIDEKFHEKIFIIFQRLHNKKDYQGTGIGLAICKKIVEQHGGKIWVVSEIDRGSKFFFTILKLPLSQKDSSMLNYPELLTHS